MSLRSRAGTGVLAGFLAIGAAPSFAADPPPGSVVVDGFDRPDAPTLGSTETGQAWSTWSGTTRVAGGQAEATGAGYSLAVVGSTTAKGTASVTVAVPSAELWLVVRASDAANYWRFGRWQNGPYVLQQVVNSALGTPAITGGATVSPAAGDRLSCKLASGLTCSVNGTTVATTADGFNATAEGVGLAAGSGAVTRFDDLWVLTPPAARDLGVAVVAKSSSVATGAPVAWTATVTNTGTVSATSTVLTVSVPAGVSKLSLSSTVGSCKKITTATWTCALGTRAVGSTATVTVNGTAPATDATLRLTASVAAAGVDADPANDSAGADISVRVPPPPGSVVVDGFDRPDAPTLGSTETGQAWSTWSGTTRVAGGQAEATGAGYSLAVVGSTTAKGTASVTVAVPSAELWLVVRASDAANYWRFGRWQNGPYVLQQVVNSALGTPAITGGATVSPAAGDRLSCKLASGLTCSVNGTTVATTADGFNATAEGVGLAAGSGAVTRFDDLWVLTPPAARDLGVAVVAKSSSVATGAPVAWTATVTNTGTVSATSTVLTVSVPAGVSKLSLSSTVGSCKKITTATWTCALGTRAVGSTATVTVNGTAPATDATLRLTASVAAAGADGDPSNDSASADISVRVPPAPGSVVVDGFDRPDAAALGSTETGQAWGTWSGSFGVTDGAAAPTGPGLSMATIDPGWQFGTFEVTVAAGADQGFSVVLRGESLADHFRIGPDSSGYYRMWKVVSGAVQSPQFLVIRANVVPRDGDVIRINNRPDDGIYVAVNGTHVFDGGDQSLLTARRFGLAASSPSVRFDSVWISQTISSGTTTVDGFNEADGTVLDHADAGTFYPWRMGGYWSTSAGHARQWAGYGVAWLDTSSELADARVTVVTPELEAWLLFRYSEDGSHLRCGRNAGGRYTLEAVVDNSSSVRATSTVPARPGDVIEVRQTLDGRVDCLVNGSLLMRVTDTAFNMRTTAYGMAGGGGAEFDDFTVTAK